LKKLSVEVPSTINPATSYAASFRWTKMKNHEVS
jgi:hypothetical protein